MGLLGLVQGNFTLPYPAHLKKDNVLPFKLKIWKLKLIKNATNPWK
jgi:hypothetical protein